MKLRESNCNIYNSLRTLDKKEKQVEIPCQMEKKII